MQDNPIGIFDTGVGGLSVLKEIRTQLPDESIFYLADSGNCPYGSKKPDEAAALSRKNIAFLLEQGCKCIVIACNTVTAVAIDTFRQTYRVPFVGMEPAIKPAALMTKSKRVGILATENTFKGKLFKQTCEKFASGIEVFVQPGHGLVELVEQGDLHSRQTKALLESYIGPMMEQGADTLVLGCTHYPFLIHAIREIAQDCLTIIDPSAAVARQTRRVLETENLLASGRAAPCFSFFTTADTPVTRKFLSQAMDQPYGLEQIRL